MTPETKAKEIVDKYEVLYNRTWEDYSGDWNDQPLQRDTAKACATIHCQGIIDELSNLCKPEYTSFFHGEMGNGTTMDGYELKEFYENIITEIKQL